MSTQTVAKRSRPRTPNNQTTTGFRISDGLWAVMRPLIPERANTHRFGGGRPRAPDRRCADAIFYVLRTGSQWAALCETGLRAKSTAHDRFSAWVGEGVFLRLWQAGVEHFDELRGIDGSWLSMDGTMTKAPLGGEKTGPNPNGPGKVGVKRSLLTEGHGVPLGVVIDGANRHDLKLVRATIGSLVVARPAPSEGRPQGMCLDKEYDYAEVRETLAAFGFTAHIRSRGEEARELAREAGKRARRWVVERSHSWLNHWRRLLVRREKKSAHYLAFLHFACALIAWRAADVLR